MSLYLTKSDKTHAVGTNKPVAFQECISQKQSVKFGDVNDHIIITTSIQYLLSIISYNTSFLSSQDRRLRLLLPLLEHSLFSWPPSVKEQEPVEESEKLWQIHSFLLQHLFEILQLEHFFQWPARRVLPLFGSLLHSCFGQCWAFQQI